MQKINVRITNIMGLCTILDDYDRFSDELQSLNDGRDNIYYLIDIIEGKKIFGNAKVKQFYQENSKVLEKLEKVLDEEDLKYFLHSLYSMPICKTINDFYNYIKVNKIDPTKLYKLLTRIKNLGFCTFDFYENKEFGQTFYEIYEDLPRNQVIKYLENMEVIPSYPGKISYFSERSNYLITISPAPVNVPYFHNNIAINNLTFDPNCLPSEINIYDIFSLLLEKHTLQASAINVIKYTRDLDSVIINLNEIIEQINKLKKMIDSKKTKEGLASTLKNLETELNNLRMMQEKYKEISLKRHDNLTIEDLNGQTRKLTK